MGKKKEGRKKRAGGNGSIFDTGKRCWSDAQRQTNGRRAAEQEESVLFPLSGNRNRERERERERRREEQNIHRCIVQSGF